ncbi:unnamed protein product [Pieris macdunnoughi]|uniref:Uncharacterized protein n=1 Tax=Pieris macdunnoughi TaxID=345717 RepID=A0A821V0B8_9NEOP|nr:unnamed protein product [Pieris macdunnoughi]
MHIGAVRVSEKALLINIQEDRVLGIARCWNIIYGIAVSHAIMSVVIYFPWISKVEFDAKRQSRTSAFSYAVWDSESFSLWNGGMKG